MWHKPSGWVSPLTPTAEPWDMHRTGKQTLGGHNRTLCTRTQEKGAATPQETDPDLPGMTRSLWQRCGSAVSCCRVRGTGAAVYAWDILKEVAIVFIIFTIVWSLVK